MKTILSTIFLSILLFAACTDKEKSARDQLFKQVMEVHDEIMPKMDDIMDYQKQLKEKMEALSSEAEVDSVAISKIEVAIADLDNSHDAMMGWMRQFNKDYEGMVHEDILKYLSGQKEKIKNVGEVTNAALKQAEELLAD